MLEYRQVEISFDGIPVLRDFSLTIQPGEIVALVGESGSGKTSAIRGAMGLLPPGGEVTGGEILLNGISLNTSSEREKEAMMGTQLSMIFQDSGAMLNPVRTIGSQFVEFIRTHETISRKDAWEKALTQLAITNLPNPEAAMKAISSSLSGGMRQRVGIAMAMTYKPQILFADEPTSALDVTIQAQIIRQMAQLREDYGTAILLVTHNLAVAAYLSDRIVVMQEGRIVELGESRALIQNPKADYTRQLMDAVPDFRRKHYV